LKNCLTNCLVSKAVEEAPGIIGRQLVLHIGNMRICKYWYDGIAALQAFLLQLEQLLQSLESAKWKFEDEEYQRKPSSNEKEEW
jgi:hypothetical protein